MKYLLPACDGLLSVRSRSKSSASGELYPYSVRGPADGSCPVELSSATTCFLAVGLFLVYGTGADALDCPDADFAATVVDALMELATSACEATVYGQPSYLKMRTVSV